MKTKKISHNELIISSFLAVVSCLTGVCFVGASASALTYQSSTNVGFTFNPTISISLSSDLLISSLSPGSTADSNIINVAINTNASQGYVLTATAGTSSTTTNLVNNSNSSYTFTSLATNATLTDWTNASDNTWGYSYSEDNGTTWISGKDGSNQNILGYSGLPLDNNDNGETGKTLISTTLPSDNKTLKFKIGAKAASSQASGDYTNTINFYAVANPEPSLGPVSCPAGKICYNANSLTTVTGEMGQQTIDYTTPITDGSSFTVYPSNFKNDGYGFAGWSDSYTGNGAKYGPNQTITAPNDFSTNGYSLYAMWVPSAGNMQGWTGCSNLAKGQVTALTDTRDNDVYAVAKLADDKCWMIENLRLDNTPELSFTNTHNPSLPLTNIYDSSTTSNHLSPTSSAYYNASTNPEGWCGSNTTACIDQSRLNTVNTVEFINHVSSNFNPYNGDIYIFGNYYNWYSATAGHGKYGNSYGQDFNALGDICPAGWHLPRGGLKSYESNNEFWALIVTGINNGVNPSNYDSTTQPGYDGNNSNPEGPTVSNVLRSYPNNFVLSGDAYGAYAGNRNSTGHYWTSTGYNSYDAEYMTFGKDFVRPGNRTDYKYNGKVVRCVAGT